MGAYPITTLIEHVMRDSGLRRGQFVRALGYINTSKGCRRMDRWLRGSGDREFLQRLCAAFPVDPVVLEDAVQKTAAILENEWKQEKLKREDWFRQKFRPYLWIVTEHGPHSVISAMRERIVKVIYLPTTAHNIGALGRMTEVQQLVREHFGKTKSLNSFGAILRYRWVDTFDTSLILDVDGTVLDESGGQFLLPEVWMAFR